MRLTVALAASLSFASITFAQTPVAPAPDVQVWEKPVVEGVTYRMEVDRTLPRVICAVKLKAGTKGVTPRAELGSAAVMAEGGGRNEVGSVAERIGALVGINADFFPWTGDPLGAMVRDGELISSPFGSRPAFGMGAGGSVAALLSWDAALSWGDGSTLRIDGLNELCGDDMVVLNMPVAGRALASKAAMHAVIDLTGKLTPECRLTGTFRYFVADATSVPVVPGVAVLTATGAPVKDLLKLKRGDPVTVEVRVKGADWGAVTEVVGGGQFLLQDGKVNPDPKAGGFAAEFSSKRHPRTAVGRTKTGDVWFVVVDGRQSHSVGASLPEMAAILSKLGCVDAINLDGGGSTTLVLDGQVMNRPSDGRQRKVANGLYLIGPARPTPVQVDPEDMVVKGPGRIAQGEQAAYQAVGADGNPVPNDQVIWSASGAGWIDQDGVLRTVRPGTANLSARVGDRRLNLSVLVEPAVEASRAAPRAGRAKPVRPATKKAGTGKKGPKPVRKER